MTFKNKINFKAVLKSDTLKLLPILVLAYFLSFIPHQGYDYPVHIDEWMHLSYMEAIIEAQDTTFEDPFGGVRTLSINSTDFEHNANLRFGYYTFWSMFHQITGISWNTIFKYFPAAVFLITVLGAYILGRRANFGWEAALLTSLLPTTVGILGPGFMVPVAMGLVFLPLSAFVALYCRGWCSYALIILFFTCVLTMHPATAVGMAIIIIPYTIVCWFKETRHGILLTIAIALTFILPLSWIFSLVLDTLKTLFVPQTVATWVSIPDLLDTVGYIPVILCLLGTFFLITRGTKENIGLALGSFCLVIMLAVFQQFHYGIRFMYERGFQYSMLMLGIISGAGLMSIRHHLIPGIAGFVKNASVKWKYVGIAVTLVVIAGVLSIGIPFRMQLPYYHMIDEYDYQSFVWIRNNVDAPYNKAILDPWKATAFTAITKKNIYSRIHAYPLATDLRAYEFLEKGCTDTEFLKDHDISIVYTRSGCSNPDLVKIHEGIYLLKEEDGS